MYLSSLKTRTFHAERGEPIALRNQRPNDGTAVSARCADGDCGIPPASQLSLSGTRTGQRQWIDAGLLQRGLGGLKIGLLSRSRAFLIQAFKP